MASKSKKRFKRWASVDSLDLIRHNFERGDYKRALKYARVRYRQEATPELRSLLEHIYIARGEQLSRQGLREDSRRIIQELLDLGVTQPSVRIEQARQHVLGEWTAELKDVRNRLDELYRTQPWWRRALIGPWHQATRDLYSDRTLETGRQIFESLQEGYDLIQSRLRWRCGNSRLFASSRIGKLADPHGMTVVEVVSDPSRPSGTVVEEVRPGYYWDGKVLRFAEVKAVGQR